MQTYFVIGTDTDCGKTYVSCELLRQMPHAFAIKPIASGGMGDIDALKSLRPNLDSPIHHFVFEPPIAPHLAALQAGIEISFEQLDDIISSHEANKNYNTLLVETTGGLMCPINNKHTWLDYIAYTQKPVIFVVGMRLGCLNHALLTALALKARNIPCAGWIANCIDGNMDCLEENIQTLQQLLPFEQILPETTVPEKYTAPRWPAKNPCPCTGEAATTGCCMCVFI